MYEATKSLGHSYFGALAGSNTETVRAAMRDATKDL